MMAQKQQPDQTSRVIEDATVVDTDIHVNQGMPIEEVASYLDEPYKSHMLKPTVSPLPISGWNRSLGGKIEGGNLSGPEDIQQTLCEGFGVDYPVLNTTSWLPRLPQSDLAVALMRAYNDLLLDKFLDDYDHFRGLLTIATQKPHKAAEEIDRLGNEDQIVGIYIATTGSMIPIGDERYDVIYKAAQDNDLTITYHASGGAFQFDFNRQNQGLEKFFSIHTLAHPWGQMLTMVSLMENGIWEKFPDLDFMFLESGLLWVPYMMYRMNREYSMRRSELPLLEKSPEEYIRERATFSTQPVGEPNNPSHIVQTIDMLGPDNIVFSTDYPHWDFDSPEGIDKYIRQADDEVREKILGENAAKAFGIDI
jgi:predicted TIM-barrel fold metal-dependent hydrolase